MLPTTAHHHMLNVTITLPGLGPLEDGGTSILDHWRTAAPSLAAMEHTSIVKREPEDTGTLVLATTQEVNPDKDVLARIYTDPDAQLSGPWQRVYAQYQEGPPLGHTTYTRQTPHFFYRAATDDIEQIRAWALAAGGQGVSDIVGASEAQATTETF